MMKKTKLAAFVALYFRQLLCKEKDPVEEARRLSNQMREFLNNVEASNIDAGDKKLVRNEATKFLMETP